jgi:hypothetical protein
MVTENTRGQLILVGALLLATIIFGVSFLLSSVVFTDVAGAGESAAAVGQVDQIDEEMRRGTGSLIVRVNHRQRHLNATEIATAVESNVTRFSRLYGESKAAAGAVSVSVAYDNGSSELGRRIVQVGDGEYRDAEGDTDWAPVPNSPDARVGWFTANVAIENTSEDPFAITAENRSGDELDLDIARDGSNLTVTADPGWAAATMSNRTGRAGRALLDLFDGSAYTSDCSFTGVGALSGPVALEFEDSHRIEGRFSIVTNRSNGQVGDEYEACDVGPPRDEPCIAPVVWSANLTTSVRSDRVSYGNAFNFSVYARER